ncbi:15110_t:CDS:2 [Rhizophagus irregularis]|nr:15110_t:CDS:2 [Rhizophagus irregularis]
MFSVIQQQINAFGGLNVIVVGDLAHQYNFNGFFYFVKWYNAKIVTAGLPVYKSSEWKYFYSLF